MDFILKVVEDAYLLIYADLKKMARYSLSREDFIERLVLKYNKYIMKEAIYIEWESCSKCYIMKPHCKKWAEDNWYEFQNFLFSDIWVSEFKSESVPMLILKENWKVKEILNEEWIVNLISNQK